MCCASRNRLLEQGSSSLFLYDLCQTVYLSPESLLSRSDISDLIGDRVIGLLIMDEAHIVTTWGKQFRPDYWFLGDYVNKLRKQQLNGPHQQDPLAKVKTAMLLMAYHFCSIRASPVDGSFLLNQCVI